MNKVSEAFQKCRQEGRKAFIPFLAAGDGGLQASLTALKILDDAGADIIEIGVPFSDPIADGPIIQAGYQRALERQVSLRATLGALQRIRLRAPLLLFTYLNPVLQLALRWGRSGNGRVQDPEVLEAGLRRLARTLVRSGVGGILISDLTPEEARVYRHAFASGGIDTVFLAAPTTTEARIRKILPVCSGFVYLVSRTGVTGKQTRLGGEARRQVEMVRRHSAIPIAVGFGMRTPADVARATSLADGVVVGSAIVEKLHELSGQRDWQKKFRRYIEAFVRAARGGASRGARKRH